MNPSIINLVTHSQDFPYSRMYRNDIEKIKNTYNVENMDFWNLIMNKSRVSRGAVKGYNRVTPAMFVSLSLLLRGYDVVVSTHIYNYMQRSLHGLVEALTVSEDKYVTIETFRGNKYNEIAMNRHLAKIKDGSGNVEYRLGKVKQMLNTTTENDDLPNYNHVIVIGDTRPTNKVVKSIIETMGGKRQVFAHISKVDDADTTKESKLLDDNLYTFDMNQDISLSNRALKEKIKESGKKGVLIRDTEGNNTTLNNLSQLVTNDVFGDSILGIV